MFDSLYAHGFARVAACTVAATLADPLRNAAAIAAVARDCADRGVAVAVFPELSISGYALDDLFGQDVLLDAVHAGLAELAAATATTRTLLVVGAPLVHGGALYNCAVALQGGEVLGVVPKIHLPTYREFYERRQFTSGAGVSGESITVAGAAVPFGTDLLFAATDVPGLVVGVEICEDMFVPVPPSARLALAGATVLLNLSASPITIGRAETRTLLARSQSLRCLAGYVYTAAGQGESTTDLSWDGQSSVCENGRLLAAGARFAAGAAVTVADIDLELLAAERRRQGTFSDNASAAGVHRRDFRRIEFTVDPPAGDLGLAREVERFPFVPADPDRLAQDCYEAYHIQVSGLAQRLSATGTRRVVIGVSGGLDSTQALVVAARAMDLLGRPRSDILGYTLPGFATTEHTRGNAHALMAALGVSAGEIDIRPAARQLLADIGHPYARGEEVYDLTFENVQAGLRTDYLFRLAGANAGIVLGTGDLSELALGWCTYGVGDQMSHYNVNAGVPKTLIQHLIRWAAGSGDFSAEAAAILTAVLDTEISPELIPTREGEKPQSTEATIGPYELHDFSLFHTLRFGFRPSKIAFLARHAWSDAERGAWPANFPADRRRSYDLDEIRSWLQVFARRFFGFAQFKRSAMPNGPKVTAGGSLSPRGDWRAPSDGNAAIWLADIETIPTGTGTGTGRTPAAGPTPAPAAHPTPAARD